MRLIPLLAFCVLIVSTGFAQTRTDVQGYETTDALMKQAIAEARQSVPTFLTQLAAPKADYRYLVKMRIEADGHVEHMWVEPVQVVNGLLRGPLANAPAKITSLKEGSLVSAQPAEISDWVILDDSGNVKAGGYTQKVMERQRGPKPQ